MDYDEDFENKLKSVEKNYYGSYLVEFFEKRTPRNLDIITVDWKGVEVFSMKPQIKPS